MAAAAVGASLCWFPGSSSVLRSLCHEGVSRSAQGPSSGRAEDAWKFPQRAMDKGMKTQLHVDVYPANGKYTCVHGNTH